MRHWIMQHTWERVCDASMSSLVDDGNVSELHPRRKDEGSRPFRNVRTVCLPHHIPHPTLQ